MSPCTNECTHPACTPLIVCKCISICICICLCIECTKPACTPLIVCICISICKYMYMYMSVYECTNPACTPLRVDRRCPNSRNSPTPQETLLGVFRRTHLPRAGGGKGVLYRFYARRAHLRKTTISNCSSTRTRTFMYHGNLRHCCAVGADAACRLQVGRVVGAGGGSGGGVYR